MNAQPALFALPEPDRFQVALLDPPWTESGGGKIKRGADRHYPLVRTADMPEVIRSSGLWHPDQDAHIYMWVTNNYLADGLWLLEQLGARYVTNVCWTKITAAGAVARGIGQYFRGSHELMLFGVVGAGMALRSGRRDLPSAILAPTGRHSEKPAVFYELIEARSNASRRVEFFARSNRPGWVSWGNQVGGADAASA